MRASSTRFRSSLAHCPLCVDVRNSGTGSQREKKIFEDTSVEVHEYLRKLSREENAKLLEDLKFRGMIYNDLPPEELTKIQERLKPVLDKFTKEVGEDLVKQTRVELEKVENRTRSLRGSSRPFAGGRESALNARACYMREGRLAHPTYTTATADLFRGLLANAGDLDHSGLLVELERRNGIQN